MAKDLKIFISYRRADLGGQASGIVGRIYDRLSDHFGEANVFMDMDGIPPGVPFDKYIDKAVGRSDILVAVVGKEWIGEIQSRINDEKDYVRVEIESALGNNIPVIPLLVGGAKLPTSDQLPSSLKSFVMRNAYSVDTGRDFNPHITRLIADLEKHFDPTTNSKKRKKSARRKQASPESGVSKKKKSCLFPLICLVAMTVGLLYFKDQIPGLSNLPSLPFQKKTFTNSIGMTFVWCPPGRIDVPAVNRNIELTRGFWISKYEVTVDQWNQIMSPTDFKPEYILAEQSNEPVWEVSWTKAKLFCDKLSAEEIGKSWRNDGSVYRLPTEAQWEYAYRAGTSTQFFFGDNSALLEDYEWLEGEAPKAIGTKKPNPWGIYDMGGNVWEWCENWADIDYDGSLLVDPKGPANGTQKVLIGGSTRGSSSGPLARHYGEANQDWYGSQIGFRPILMRN